MAKTDAHKAKIKTDAKGAMALACGRQEQRRPRFAIGRRSRRDAQERQPLRADDAADRPGSEVRPALTSIYGGRQVGSATTQSIPGS